MTNALCMACMTSFIAVAGPLVRELGLAEWHGGLIITLAGVCWMLFSRAWGSDRFLRRVRRGVGCGFSGLPGAGRQFRDGGRAGCGRRRPLGGSGSGHGPAPLAGTALYGIFPELPYIMTAAALVLMSGIARLRTPGTEAARQAAIRR